MQYEITADLKSYFTVTRGYKGPQVTPAAEGSAQSVVGAEIPTAFELGIKGRALDHRLGWDGDVFYSRVHDYQGQACSINPVGALVCIEPVRSASRGTKKGSELNTYGTILPRVVRQCRLYLRCRAISEHGYTGYDPQQSFRRHHEPRRLAVGRRAERISSPCRASTILRWQPRCRHSSRRTPCSNRPCAWVRPPIPGSCIREIGTPRLRVGVRSPVWTPGARRCSCAI